MTNHNRLQAFVQVLADLDGPALDCMGDMGPHIRFPTVGMKPNTFVPSY
jgi:hypothetical protein